MLLGARVLQILAIHFINMSLDGSLELYGKSYIIV